MKKLLDFLIFILWLKNVFLIWPRSLDRSQSSPKRGHTTCAQPLNIVKPLVQDVSSGHEADTNKENG